LSATPRARAMVAGLLLGVALTFKLSGGLLAIAAFSLFLLGRDAGDASASPWSAARGVGLAALAAVAALLGVVRRSVGSWWSTALLMSPMAAVALSTARRVRRASRALLSRNLTDLACFGAAAAIMPTLLVVYFAAHGLLGAMAWAVAFGLPRLFAFAI